MYISIHQIRYQGALTSPILACNISCAQGSWRTKTGFRHIYLDSDCDCLDQAEFAYNIQGR